MKSGQPPATLLMRKRQSDQYGPEREPTRSQESARSAHHQCPAAHPAGLFAPGLRADQGRGRRPRFGHWLGRLSRNQPRLRRLPFRSRPRSCRHEPQSLRPESQCRPHRRAECQHGPLWPPARRPCRARRPRSRRSRRGHACRIHRRSRRRGSDAGTDPRPPHSSHPKPPARPQIHRQSGRPRACTKPRAWAAASWTRSWARRRPTSPALADPAGRSPDAALLAAPSSTRGSSRLRRASDGPGGNPASQSISRSPCRSTPSAAQKETPAWAEFTDFGAYYRDVLAKQGVGTPSTCCPTSPLWLGNLIRLGEVVHAGERVGMVGGSILSRSFSVSSKSGRARSSFPASGTPRRGYSCW